MNRIEPEDLRRRQLIEATIDTMASEGFSATTLALIGQKAGVSPGLIAHYFDDKDGLLEATLRSLAGRLARGLSTRLRAARTARERVQAVIEATLAPEEFDARTSSVWLAFWGQVIHSARLRRVQKVYQGRLLSNLRHGLKRIVPSAEADRLALAVAAMIDGLWLRAALSSPHETDSGAARAMASAFIDNEIARIAAMKPPARGTATKAEPRLRNYIAAPTSMPRRQKPSPRAIRRPARSSPRSRSPPRPKWSAPSPQRSADRRCGAR